ncbi:hypothetical protein COOONC_08914, partial [Cooperia oncophora]
MMKFSSEVYQPILLYVDMRPIQFGVRDLEKRQTPWPSVLAAAFMLALTGVQMSIYFMSTWQYLREIDSTATINFFGWIVAACSLGCAIANPLFGYWNQRTLSTKSPITFGFGICALGWFGYYIGSARKHGNLLYALLPLLSPEVKWYMLAARFLTGFGA